MNEIRASFLKYVSLILLFITDLFVVDNLR